MAELHSTSQSSTDVVAVDRTTIPTAGVPLCWIVDDEVKTRQFLSLVLNGLGIDTQEYKEDGAMWTDAESRLPQLVFLNVSHDFTKAINALILLAGRRFSGTVQLIGDRAQVVLEHVRNVGIEHNLKMLPVMQKPVTADLIVKTIRAQSFPLLATSATQIDLAKALEGSRIEFWYQPVVDLRKKRLASIEAFARARDPEHGLILPAGFVGDAASTSIIQLSELAVHSALKAGISFSKVGVNLPITVNIPLAILPKLPIEKLVRDYHSNPRYWPGLIVDLAEDEVIGNLKLVNELASRFRLTNVKLAIDNFGRNDQPVLKSSDLQFAQIKLDRSFITSASNMSKTDHCKSVIDLAHRFGATPVAIGIEKAADATALMSLGCSFGQGYLLGQPMAQDRFVSLLRRRLAIENRSLRRCA